MQLKTILSYCSLALCCALLPSPAAADEPQEPVPTAVVTNKDGETTTLSPGETFTGEAPLSAVFTSNAAEVEGYTCVCEWQFKKADEEDIFLKRYEAETTYDFKESGTITVTLIVTYTSKSNSEIIYEYSYDAFSVTVSESTLKCPNAFSPNGDGINDYFNVYNVKSIVDFKGTIFNRWGQKLYSWGLDKIGCDDCGWDGTYHGKPVKAGVYYVVIEARGADGVKYSFKRDVNLLRGFTETGTSNNE